MDEEELDRWVCWVEKLKKFSLNRGSIEEAEGLLREGLEIKEGSGDERMW